MVFYAVEGIVCKVALEISRTPVYLNCLVYLRPFPSAFFPVKEPYLAVGIPAGMIYPSAQIKDAARDGVCIGRGR